MSKTNPNSNPTIFLSYCRADTSFADTIDNDFKAIGFTMRRDVRDVKYRDSIKEFMNKIGEHDFVVMLISRSYLRSVNCMYEVTELLNFHKFEHKILPVLLPDAGEIFDKAKRYEYYRHWQDQQAEAEARLKDIINEDHQQQVRQHRSINEHLGVFFNMVTDMNLKGFDNLRETNYEPMLALMGVEHPNLLEEVIEISKIVDSEEQELTLEKFLTRHPNNRYGLFQKAMLAHNRQEFKKSKAYWKSILNLYNGWAEAHYNFAILLAEDLKEYETARKHYEQVLAIDPNNVNAHNNLANLLRSEFKEFVNARNHYEQALIIDPNHATAHFNFAILFESEFQDYEEARKHYEHAVSVDHQSADTHYNLARLLENKFKEYDAARKHYEQVLTIDPYNLRAHNNLAILLTVKFKEYKTAREHYERALIIDPNYLMAHFNLAFLLQNEFKEYKIALKHYGEVLKINPDYVDAHYYLAVLLDQSLGQKRLARPHYLRATEIDTKKISAELDEYFGITR